MKLATNENKATDFYCKNKILIFEIWNLRYEFIVHLQNAKVFFTNDLNKFLSREVIVIIFQR